MCSSANQELYKLYKQPWRKVVMVSLILLTVKSLKTRFREPLRRAMRAALGWFTIAFGARGAGVLPAAGGVLYDTISTHTQINGILTQWTQMKSTSQWMERLIKKAVCTGKKSDWDFAPAAPLVWVQPAKLLENSAYPEKEGVETLIFLLMWKWKNRFFHIKSFTTSCRNVEGVLPVDVWWRTVSAGGRVHIPPIDNGLHTHLSHHVALLRGKTPEMAFQTT